MDVKYRQFFAAAGWLVGVWKIIMIPYLLPKYEFLNGWFVWFICDMIRERVFLVDLDLARCPLK